MYGFIGAFSLDNNNCNLVCHKHNKVKTVENKAKYGSFVIERISVDKFIDDKVFFEDDDLIIVIEGILYNFSELEKKYASNDRGLLLRKMFFELNAKGLAEALNGYFSGAIFNKKGNELFLITDHITYKPLWYAVYNNTVFFSTDIDWLYSTMQKNGIQLELDFDGAYCLINYGYMLGDCTPVKNVKKLIAGNVLCANNETIIIDSYYSIPEPSNNRLLSTNDYEELLKNIDIAFKNSVRRVYEKDNEYRYKHCATLSGGLDSRLVVLTAAKLGYKTLCLTMGEAGCPDIRISSKICNDFYLEHLIYELNNGIYLMDYDNAIIGNGGTILSPGYLHSYRLKSLVDFAQYGAIHSGDLGDAILGGSYLKYVNKKDISIEEAMYSSGYLDGFSEEFKEKEKQRYVDQYQFNFYNRGLNSAGNGCIATQCYTECSSPFIDKQLLNLIFSIPYNYVKDHKLYIDYIKEYLPEACEYVWDGVGCKPNSSGFKKKIIYYTRAFRYRVLRNPVSMNPYDKWFKNNQDLRTMFEQLFKQGDYINNVNPNLYKDLYKRFSSDGLMDKSLSCTLIRLINKYKIQIMSKKEYEE